MSDFEKIVKVKHENYFIREEMIMWPLQSDWLATILGNDSLRLPNSLNLPFVDGRGWHTRLIGTTLRETQRFSSKMYTMQGVKYALNFETRSGGVYYIAMQWNWKANRAESTSLTTQLQQALKQMINCLESLKTKLHTNKRKPGNGFTARDNRP